jgi:hypothetical protein
MDKLYFHTVKILHPYVALSARINGPILYHMDLQHIISFSLYQNTPAVSINLLF